MSIMASWNNGKFCSYYGGAILVRLVDPVLRAS